MKLKTILHRTTRPTKAELDNLVTYYNCLTAELPDGWTLEHLDSPEKCHWLMLSKIAEYREMGVLFSIGTAFKMGYLYGQGKIELGVPESDYNDAHWAQEYRERTSKILVELTDADALARIFYAAKREKEARQQGGGERHEEK